MEKILLYFLDLFSGLYRIAGVDYKQLRAIVGVKLTLDGRRQMLTMGQQSSNRGFFVGLLIYALFGGFLSLLIFALPSLILALILIFSYIMVMIIMILITDFSTVLLDTSDNSILFPRPVSSRTLLAARITHIILYVGLLALAISLGSIISIAIKYSFITLLSFLVCLIVSVAFALTLTNGLYLFIMRFTTEERLKNTINYLQIGMTILFMGGYQLLPRMLGSVDEMDLQFFFHWWTYLIPPVWYSATIEAIQANNFDLTHLSMILLGLMVPFISFLIVSRYLTPAFASKLQVMATDSKSNEQQRVSAKQNWLSAIIYRIVRPGIEHSGFLLTQKALARDRKLKLKIYPAIGYLVVILVLLVISFSRKNENWFAEISTSQAYLLIIYLSSITLHTILFEISFTDDFKAGWVFLSAPVQQPGQLLSGSLKAIVTSLFLPFYLVVSIIILSIWGMSALDDLIFGLINNLVIILSILIISRKHLPLSLPEGARSHGSNFGRGILMMLVLAFFGFLHYGATKLDGAIWVLTPFFAAILYFMHKSYSALSWQELRKGE